MRLTVIFPLSVILLSIAIGCGSKYGSDGEAIYMSGMTMDGTVVENIVDLDALSNKNIVLSCAGCHGEDAMGGKNTIPEFGPYVAPPITWNSLTTTEDGTPYTEELFALAIRNGHAPEGYRLHHPMPRWIINDAQMTSLIDYLKTK